MLLLKYHYLYKSDHAPMPRQADLTLDTLPYGAFRAAYRRIIDTHRHRPFALGPRGGAPEVVVLPAETYREFAAAAGEIDELRRLLPILLASAQAGVAFPSDTLASLGYRADFDEAKLAAFMRAFAVATTHDEDGQPLPRDAVAMAHAPIDEDDAELITRPTGG